ncbi:MAG TPA: ATP-binding protein [Steroidobacteraceae bacterium]|nr:ATP-binding protein [Steroidobacteraceae bacterium]
MSKPLGHNGRSPEDLAKCSSQIPTPLQYPIFIPGWLLRDVVVHPQLCGFEDRFSLHVPGVVLDLLIDLGVQDGKVAQDIDHTSAADNGRDALLAPAQLRRRKYLSTALLVIDELGFEPMNRQDASLFFRLVTYRYGRGAFLITTNKSVREWTELLAGDEVLATAVLDRLLHRANVLNIKGRSYRLRDLEQALGSQKV